jgi:hypothetical protein
MTFNRIGVVFVCALLSAAAMAAESAETELTNMCKVCGSTSGCYDYGVKPDACTYPPCPNPLNVTIEQLSEQRLVCASCRSNCPNTPGGPGAGRPKKAAAPAKTTAPTATPPAQQTKPLARD